MFVAGVVGHHVDEDAETELVRRRDQPVGIGQRAEQRIHVLIVGHVVARVSLRRRIERRDPHRVDAEVTQVRQPCGNAGQVTDAVIVGARERARVDLVDHGGAPPLARRRRNMDLMAAGSRVGHCAPIVEGTGSVIERVGERASH